MHTAPSVTYPVGRSRLGCALLVSVWLLGACVVVLWSMQPGQAGWRPAVAGAVLAAAGVLAALDWRAGPVGTLAWDGESWAWTALGASAPGRIGVRLDLQHSLLIRFEAATASHWLWLERKTRPGRWDDLRRAVYSRAGSPALPTGEAPAHNP